MRTAVRKALAGFAPALLIASLATGHDDDASRPEPSDRTGWFAEVRGAGAERAAFRSPVAALALEADQTLHPAVPAVGFAVRFRTVVPIRQPGRYRFGLASFGGAASLDVRDAGSSPLACEAAEGEVWTAWADLARGAIEVDVGFSRAAGAAPAHLSTLWEMAPTKSGGFPPEPLTGRDARVPAGLVVELADGEREREGRILLGELGCTNCHDPGEGARHAVDRRPAPNLTGVVERLSPDWIREWVRSPAAIEEHAPMPGLFEHVPGAEDEVRALLHFLASLGETDDEPPAPWRQRTDDHSLGRGRELFHTVGCVACHGALESPAEVFGDPFLPDELPAHEEDEEHETLDDLAGKFTPAGLAAFLRDPLTFRPGGEMPAFPLEVEELDLVSSYLASRWPVPASVAIDPDPELAARGRGLFQERGCAACHTVEDLAPTAPAPPLATLDPARGCLDPDDPATPRYVFDDATRDALVLGLASVRGACGAPAPRDAVERTVLTHGCLSCHAREGEGGPSEGLDLYFRAADERVDLGDEGRLPPDLTGVGARLNATWMHAVLEGRGAARPYLAARMPLFGADNVRHLSEALARREGVVPGADAPEPEPTPERVATGRDLMGRQALGCIACHVFKDYPPSGSPGLDLAGFAERLRYDWYRTFVLNPQRHRPGSRMPDFATGGKSTLGTVYDGDAALQADAMWTYFALADSMPPPPDVDPGAGMRLVVEERPIVLRAFLEDAGSRAIAVGMPEGVHFAFDAEGVRLAYAWQGDFLDAAGAWAGRGGTILAGQGPRVWTAPAGPPLVLVEAGAPAPEPWPEVVGEEAGHRFVGYRLDAAGVPSFIYEVDGVRVVERFASDAAGSEIRRSFGVAELPRGRHLWVRAGDAENVFHEASAGVAVETVDRADGRYLRIRPPAGVGFTFTLGVRL